MQVISRRASLGSSVGPKLFKPETKLAFFPLVGALKDKGSGHEFFETVHRS